MSQKVTPTGFGNSSDEKSVKEIIERFAGETTAHGIPHIIERPKLISKIFWFTLVAAAFAVFCWQTRKLLQNVYASNTKIELINRQSVAFPAVTVCNLNKLKRSKLGNSTRWKEIVFIENRLDIFQEGQNITASVDIPRNETLNRRKRENEQYQWYYNSVVDDFSDIVGNDNATEHTDTDDWDYTLINPTRQEFEEMGHQVQDFILDCRFNARQCEDRHFKTTQNQEYGNCFTFNGNNDEGEVERVTKAGSSYGLHLTLFIEHDEYLGSLTEEAGVRVMPHDRDIMPHPEDVGLSLSPGFSTNIGIRQVEIKRLLLPHGNCTFGGENIGFLSNNSYNYSILSCQKKCFLDQLSANCSCVTEGYLDYDGIRLCDRSDRMCRQSVEKDFYSNELDCECPAPCRELVYNTQTTSARWPTDRNYHILRHDLCRTGNHKACAVLNDVHVARENLVNVKIYFQELNYELVEQVPANTLESVIGTTGGLLGLYIGFSLITVVETFILMYDVIVLMCKRIMPK